MSKALTLLKELIACESITPNDAGCQEIIRERLKHTGFVTKAFPFADVENSWIRYGDSGPLFVFLGHTDVVPAGNENSWQFPPFQPTVADQKLYGRGVVDMKGAIAAMVIACEQFMAANPAFPGSIAFLLTSDEEGHAIHGTQKVVAALKQQQIKIDYCLVGEASSEKKIGDQIRVGRRGSLQGTLRIKGKQGHVAYPELIINPIHQSFKALQALTEKKWDQGSEHFPPTTLQITNIHAGTGALNVVPGELEILFNLRFNDVQNPQQIQQDIETLLQAHQLQYELTMQVSSQLFLSKPGRLVQKTKQAIKNLTGYEPQLSTGGGTSDGRFMQEIGAEIVELGLRNATAHHANEHVDLKELETLTQIYLQVLTQLFLH